MHISNYHRRIKAVFLLFYALFAVSLTRLFFVQFFRSNFLAAIAKKQHNLYVELEPLRGTIYDSNLRPLAVNVSADSLYAVPTEIQDKEHVINVLSQILNLDQGYLREKLCRKKSFVWLARKISPEQKEAIKQLNIKGLEFLKESKRCYPNGYLASHILGFAGLDNVGLEGLELYRDNELRGKSGWALFLRDARQKKLNLAQKMIPPQDGFDLVLTIDEVIQYIAEKEIEKAYTTFKAKGASIIVMDPHTGEILAMANRPTFDLNDFSQVDKEKKRNRAICDLFEPGSVFKIVTASAALEEGKVKEDDRFFCENGSYKVATHILHDHTSHGWLTFKEVIEQSSNIGTTKVAQILGDRLVFRYVKLFGFGSKLGVDLPGEISGVAKDPRFWSKITIAAMPIGQEIGVTAIQLASAISCIANGGQLMKPYIVKQVRDKQGEIIRENTPELLTKTISLDTANRVKMILTGVVENGTGQLARINGFTAAGKTGTGQKLEPNGTYSHTKFMASFIGFAPAENPLIAIVVVLDEPHPYYGGVVAAPVFKNVAGNVLKYLRSKHIDVNEELFVENENKGFAR